MTPKKIADGVHYISNRGANIYFVGTASSWTLIDTGWGMSASAIRKTAAALFGSDSPPESIVLTHVHPDHDGSAAELARHWGLPVHVHPDELGLARGDFAAIRTYASPLDRWLLLPGMRLLGKQRREAILAKGSLGNIACAFDPSEGVPGLTGWKCIHTPGHTPGHVVFSRGEDRVVIAGDAVLTAAMRGILPLVQHFSLPPRMASWDWQRTRESLRKVAALKPQVLATGHGMPMIGDHVSGDLDDFVKKRT